MTIADALTAKERAKIAWSGRQVHIVVPSVVEPAEPFSVRISVVGPDHMPMSEPVVMRFTNSGAWRGLPAQCEVVQGGAHFRDLRVEAPGAYYLAAQIDAPDTDGWVYSNPLWVSENPAARLFWGDLHVHSLDGGCHAHAAQPPQLALLYARDVTFLDFVAITDHNRRLDAQKWAAQQALVRAYDRPGAFVPFLGFESSHRSGRGGDNNAYFKDCDGEFMPRRARDNTSRLSIGAARLEVTLEDLWGFLGARGHEFMTIPHHTGRAVKLRSWAEPRHHPAYEMLYEVYSMWGSSECHPSRYPLWGGNADEPAYFRDAIERGCRFGVIASSDDHTSLPGSESILRYPGRALFGTYPHHGLAGIFAPSLDRASLWAAMRARRTLATTYGRPVLLFEAEGAQAGEEVEVTGHESAARARHLRVRYLPPFPERKGIRLAVLRNGQPMLEETLDCSQREEMCCLEAVDETTFDTVMIRGAPFSPRPFIAYSVRLDTRQGGTVWSSPIWFVR